MLLRGRLTKPNAAAGRLRHSTSGARHARILQMGVLVAALALVPGLNTALAQVDEDGINLATIAPGPNTNTTWFLTGPSASANILFFDGSPVGGFLNPYPLPLPAGSNLTIEGNGGRILLFSEGVTQGSQFFGNGFFCVGGTIGARSCDTAGVVPPASLTLLDTIVQQASGGAAVIVTSGSKLTVNGGAMVFNSFFGGPSTLGGAAIQNSGGTVIIEPSAAGGTLFQNNSVTQNGGAIINNGTLTVTGATFETNHADFGAGGAIEVGSGSSATIDQSDFIGNTASTGGAIEHTGIANTLSIENSTFMGNSATFNGGAIDDATAGMTIANSNFMTNTSAFGVGGAISISGPTTNPTITDSNVVFYTGKEGNAGSHGQSL